MTQPVREAKARKMPITVSIVEDSRGTRESLTELLKRTILPKLLDYVKQRQIDVISAEEYVPPFDDIFVHLIENETARQKEGVNA
jgi:hypothetical protein